MLASRSEKSLDRALAAAIERSSPLLELLVSRTKFAQRDPVFESCRCDNPWGTHPFIQIDEVSGVTVESRRQSETDILVILRATDGEVLGLHIENKLGAGRFTSNQPELYAQRAKHWIGNPRYGAYTAFDTLLIAPLDFSVRHADQLKHFGGFVSHEELSAFIPEFVDPTRVA